MKKLLKNFAILTVFACGLFTGCNNDAEFDLNVNVTVSTDTPSLDEPKNLGYGVLLTWGITQDANYFRVTRQENGGEEKILTEEGVEDNRYFDRVSFANELKEGVEYTYRVYNLGDKTRRNYEDDTVTKGTFYYGDNCVVKTSYAEKKITLAAGSLKKQGEKLEAINKDNVKTSFKNGILKIYLNDENRDWGLDVVVRDAETGKKLHENDYGYFENISAQKVNVEIKNVSYDGYYADSDAVTIENIENTKDEESVSIYNFTATRNGKTVVLHWNTYKKVEASEFKVLRTKIDYSNDYVKPEILKISPSYEETNNGTYCWTAIDETAEVGTGYKYEVITTDSNSNTASVPGDNLNSSISLNVSVNGYSYSSKIYDTTDKICLSFVGDKNLTYKGYWTTVDNKDNESARTPFDFTKDDKDNDEHYRKVFTASDIKDLKKSVRVNFYVKCYDGDKLIFNNVTDDWGNVLYTEEECKKTVYVAPSLTTYTAITYLYLEQNRNQEDYSKTDIFVYISGANLENVIKVTYFKGDGEFKPLTLTKVTDSYYTATLTVAESGKYTICATVPEDNAYPSDYYNNYSYRTDDVNVDN